MQSPCKRMWLGTFLGVWQISVTPTPTPVLPCNISPGVSGWGAGGPIDSINILKRGSWSQYGSSVCGRSPSPLVKKMDQRQSGSNKGSYLAASLRSLTLRSSLRPSLKMVRLATVKIPFFVMKSGKQRWTTATHSRSFLAWRTAGGLARLP